MFNNLTITSRGLNPAVLAFESSSVLARAGSGSRSAPETLLEVFTVNYSYPNIYYGVSPNFTIKANFWRIEIETIPYYVYNKDYIAYYSATPVPFSLRILKDVAFFGNPFSIITMLSPLEYNVSSCTYQEVRGFGFYYVWAGGWKYASIKVNCVYNIPGTYSISSEVGLGCFNFTIEEYS